MFETSLGHQNLANEKSLDRKNQHLVRPCIVERYLQIVIQPEPVFISGLEDFDTKAETSGSRLRLQ